MIHRKMNVCPLCFEIVIRSLIREASLVDRSSMDDTVRAHFNLVGGGFHCVLSKPICCGKDYGDRSSRKQD